MEEGVRGEYKQMVDDESKLSLKVQPCEEIASALCQWVYKHGEQLDIELVSEFMDHIGLKQCELFNSMMLLRLKKAEIARLIESRVTEMNNM